MRMWLEYLMLKSSDKKSIDLFWKGAGMTMKTKNKEFLVNLKHDWMLFKKKLATTFSSCIRRFYSTTHIFVSLLSFFGESADFFLFCVGSYEERTKIFYCWWDYIEQWRIFHTILFDAMILISQTFSLFLLDSNWSKIWVERESCWIILFFMC